MNEQDTKPAFIVSRIDLKPDTSSNYSFESFFTFKSEYFSVKKKVYLRSEKEPQCEEYYLTMPGGGAVDIGRHYELTRDEFARFSQGLEEMSRLAAECRKGGKNARRLPEEDAPEYPCFDPSIWENIGGHSWYAFDTIRKGFERLFIFHVGEFTIERKQDSGRHYIMIPAQTDKATKSHAYYELSADEFDGFSQRLEDMRRLAAECKDGRQNQRQKR